MLEQQLRLTNPENKHTEPLPTNPRCLTFHPLFGWLAIGVNDIYGNIQVRSVELRSKRPNVTLPERIVVHAGSNHTPQESRLAHNKGIWIPAKNVLIGTVVIYAIERLTPQIWEEQIAAGWERGDFPDNPPWVWLLRDPQKFPTPIPFKGGQRGHLFPLPAEVSTLLPS